MWFEERQERVNLGRSFHISRSPRSVKFEVSSPVFLVSTSPTLHIHILDYRHAHDLGCFHAPIFIIMHLLFVFLLSKVYLVIFAAFKISRSKRRVIIARQNDS